MNRTIALFVALVTLLAHTLAIHNDGEGSFAFPYDQAYVGYRVARNLVFENQLAWNPGMPAFESYPSVLWVAICALGERISPYFHLSMNVFVQTIGIALTLLTAILSAQFRSGRIASLIAPLFIATSGCVAAAAANGLETALFTLTVLASFLALERGQPWRLSFALSLCCLTRPEGAIFAAAMLFLRVFGKPNDDEGQRPRVSYAAFAFPFLVAFGALVVRWRTTGLVLPPVASAFLHPYDGQWSDGVAFLRDFLLSSVSPLLVAFPAWYLVRGMLSRTGAHAIFVALVWTIAVGLQGRPTNPFGEPLVPALPLVFIGIQEGMIVALDATSVFARKIAVAALVVCLTGSVLASKTPGDLGPIPFGAVHERWMRSSGSGHFGKEQMLARLGLQEEIAHTIRMRRVGIFLRDQVEVGASVLTPWPGAMGYLSRQQVYDVLGRTDPMHPLDPPRTWSRREWADVVAELERDADYVVPLARAADAPLGLNELARMWRLGLDAKRDELGRAAKIEAAFSRYELITVPISDFVPNVQPLETESFYLLRARRLDARPKLEMRVDSGRFHVVLFHKSHLQVADLRLEFIASSGRTFTLRPTGELAESIAVRARSRILLYDTGARGIEILRGRVPEPPAGEHWTAMRAALRNPGCTAEDPFAEVSAEIAIDL